MFLSNLILWFILGLYRIVCHLLIGFLTRLFDFAIALVPTRSILRTYYSIAIHFTLMYFEQVARMKNFEMENEKIHGLPLFFPRVST
jgi:sulfite exporter TauE/SafE